MNADGNRLEQFAIDTMKELAEVGSNANVTILVQVDLGLLFANENGGWVGARRFYIRPGMPPRGDYALPGFANQVNMGDGEILADFVEWGVTAYPATHTALIIWGHGQGYVLSERARVVGDVSRLLLLDDLKQEVAQNVVAHGTLLHTVNVDGTVNDPLFVREIETSMAARNLFVDLIGFDSCLMATAETAYAMRSVGQVVVASEEVEAGAGWTYSWLSNLRGDSSPASAGDLATVIVEAMRELTDQSEEDSGSCGAAVQTLCALDLMRIDNFAVLLDQLVEAVMDGGATARQAVIRARRMCQPFGTRAVTYVHTIDLRHFLRSLLDETEGLERVHKLARDVLSATSRVILKQFATATLGAPPLAAEGLSIYFPLSRNFFLDDPYIDSYLGIFDANGVSFSVDHRWLELLLFIYEIDQSSLRW